MDANLLTCLLAALCEYERRGATNAQLLTVQDSASPKKNRRVKVKSLGSFMSLRRKSGVSNEDVAASLQLPATFSLSEVSENSLILTGDERFFLKTVSRAEFSQLLEMSAGYCAHMSEHPSSALVWILGAYKLGVFTSLRKVKRMLVLMENVLGPAATLAERFDLKGSEMGRRSLDGTVGKDQDFRSSGRKVMLGQAASAAFLDAVAQDVSMLQSQRLFDYSLLVGISQEKEVWEAPEVPKSRYLHISEDRRRLYFLAIIDVSSSYSTERQLENAAKSLIFDREEISCVPPDRYAERFLAAVERALE